MKPIAITITPNKNQRGALTDYRDRIAANKAAFESAASKARELEQQLGRFQSKRQSLSGKFDAKSAREITTLDTQIETIGPQKEAAFETRDEAQSRWMNAVNEAARYIHDAFGSLMLQQLKAAATKAIESFYSSTDRARHVADKSFAENTDAGLALRQFFRFQTANDENLIAAGSAQIASVLERLLAGKPAWTFK